MKKRILSILLALCMLFCLVPITVFAAGELPDVKLSVPTTFDKTVDLTKQNGELKIKDSKTYLIKGSADPNWYFQYRIKIDGSNNTPHIFLDGVRIQAPEDGPAIELYGGASACLYFIGGDSELIGAENFAALQKNKTDGYLRVLVKTGTKLTCQGGHHGAGIGGSKVGIKNFSQGHGMNLHFGSLATNIYGGEISATSGVGGAGIGGGANGGVGEQIYVYSGKLTAQSVPLYPNRDYDAVAINLSPAVAVGRGSNRSGWTTALFNPEFGLTSEYNIKIGASDGKSVRLSATGWQWRLSQGQYEWDWGTTTELLIPNENGRVDLQRLSLPYACNYGRVIGRMKLHCEESTCSHELGWTDRDGCHIWACKRRAGPRRGNVQTKRQTHSRRLEQSEAALHCVRSCA